MLPQRIPRAQPACAEEYDSDESAVRPGTKSEARSSTSAHARSTNTTEHAQDWSGRGRGDPRGAGQASYNAARGSSGDRRQPPASGTVVRQSTPINQTRPKPILHRSESKSRTQPTQPLSRTSSASGPSEASCRIPNCQDPNCQSVRNQERRFTMPRHPPQHPLQQPVQHPTQQPLQQPSQQLPQNSTPFPQSQQPTSMYPSARVPTAQLRPRALSMAHTPRPVSWAGNSNYGGNFPSFPIPIPIPAPAPAPAAQGPPPSPSAYSNLYLHQYGYNQAPNPALYTSTQQYAPSAHSMPAAAAYNMPPPPTTISARQTIPDPFAMPNSPGRTTNAPLMRTTSLSARRNEKPRQRIPGAFPGESAVSDFYSESDSGSDYEPEYNDVDSRRKRDSKLMLPPRRPSMKSARTTPNLSQRTSREMNPRAPYSENDVRPPSSSYIDPDRTPRPTLDRRYSSANSSRSRRPSVSTTASSGRTKATTISSGSSTGQIIIEGPDGRRRAYPSNQEYEEFVRRMDRQKVQDFAEAYQDAVRGSTPIELTAENIRQVQQQRPSGGSSRVSGHSRRSVHSHSKSEGIQIVTGGTILHVAGDARVELVGADENGPAKVYVDHGSSRETRYYQNSSKSSSSRVGRSRGGSERGGAAREKPISEE